MTTAPDELKQLRKDLKGALAIMDERRADYIRGRDFYDGTRAEVAASKYVRQLIKANAEAMPVTVSHIPVDIIVDMIELTNLEAQSPKARKLLDRVAEANDLADESEDWLRKAGYFGDYYAIIELVEEDLASGRIVPESIKWQGSSPLSTIVIYDPSDDTTALYGMKVWRDRKAIRARLFYDDCTVRLIAPKSETIDPKAFELDFDPDDNEDEEDAFIQHDGGRMLIEHLAIDGKPYGVPLHRKAWGPQDAITKISATNLANIEGIGLPARWALLDPMAETDEDIEADFGTNGPDTTSENSDGMTAPTRGSKVRSVPGGIAYLTGIKQVGTFDSGDGDVFLSNLDWYIRVMAVATGVPIFEFDSSTGEQPSGESRRRAMGRALKKAKRVRRASSNFLEALGTTTLATLGKADEVVTATFYPIETSTDKEGIELVGLKVKNGVPVRTALLEAGYTPDLVDEWWPEGAPGVTFDILTILGSALASLGNARTLGVISDEELADMLPTILTGARNEGARVEEEPEPTDEPTIVADPGTQLALQIKAKADAVGALVRAGADGDSAAAAVGLEGITFPNVPTTVRIPEEEAEGLEGAKKTAPAAPAVPPAPPAE